MSLDLTSGLFATLVVALALALPVVAVLVGRRVRGPWSVLRALQRWLLVVAAQGAGILAVLVVINNQFGLYSSWDDLLGRTSTSAPTVVVGGADPAAVPAAPTTAAAGTARGGAAVTQGGAGSVAGITGPAPAPTTSAVPWVNGLPQGFTRYDGPSSFVAMVAVPGSTSPMRLYVALPPQYDQPAFAHTRFPVVELFHGYPGTPTTWFHAMDVRARLAQAIGMGSTPFVLVVPQISVSGAPDLECTDLPGQPQVATFLTTEVHQVVASRFRVRDDRAGWGLMGYSEGGYCAAQLTLRNPALYAAGVEISGYDQPLSSYFDASQRRAGRLASLLRAAPPVALYASASSQDPQSSGSLTSLVRGVRAPTVVETRLYAQGGHNTSDWSAELPADFLWLTRHLGGLAG